MDDYGNDNTLFKFPSLSDTKEEIIRNAEEEEQFYTEIAYPVSSRKGIIITKTRSYA